MSKNRTIHGSDPYAPGCIEALLEHHRLTCGAHLVITGKTAQVAKDTAPAADRDQ